MSHGTTHDATATLPKSRWTVREAELLAVTLRMLQTSGYDGLNLQAVATEAKASKSTLYRRWPSKEELVLAAFIEGTRASEVAPCTGSLREDLLQIGTSVCRQVSEHGSTMRAVLGELARSPALAAAFHDEFVLRRKRVFAEVIRDAVDRGEISAEVPDDELDDVLAGYLVFRSLVAADPPNQHTVRALVDQVLIPSLTRDWGRCPRG